MLSQRGFDTRNEIAAIGFVVGLLQLATAALRKMTARRFLVVRTGSQCPIIENRVARHTKGNMTAAWRHAVASRCNPDDQLVHKSARACGIASARSSAIICGPAISAARP